jgi:hypothetical protein
VAKHGVNWRNAAVTLTGEIRDAKIPVHGRGALQKQRCCRCLSPDQLMETHDRALLDEWMANWSDLVDFEVHAVITSKDAAEEIAPRL